MTAFRLAWGFCGLVVVATIGGQLAALSTGADGDLFLTFMLSFPLVGAVLASRRPDNAIGWIMLGIGGVAALDQVLAVYADLALERTPGAWPSAALALALRDGLWVPLIGLPGTFLLLLFPDGRVPSVGWRWWAWFCGIAFAVVYLAILVMPGDFAHAGYPGLENPLGLQVLRPAVDAIYGLVLVVPLAIAGCAFALVGRFRRSHGLVRVQIKWLAAAATTVAFVYGLMMIGAAARPGYWEDGVGAYGATVFFLIPLAIGVALLRYRLYDIDRIISRTVAYGLLTGSIAAVYGGSVFALSGLFPMTGELAVAGSTLAAAAVFSPLRRRIQTAVDHRFNRDRYDSVRTVERFSQELRSQLEVHDLADALRRTVIDVVQPVSVSTWLNRSKGSPSARPLPPQ